MFVQNNASLSISIGAQTRKSALELGLTRRLPSRSEGVRCAGAFQLHEVMYSPEIFNGLIHRDGAGLNPLDEDTRQRHTELRAFLSIAADLPIEAFEVNPRSILHHPAIQHSRRLLVSLRHGT